MSEPYVPLPGREVDLISLFATNLTPIVGMLFLHWSPLNIVALYAVDMTATLIGTMWLTMIHVTEANSREHGPWHDIKLGLAALLGGLVLAGILVTPVLLLFTDSEWSVKGVWQDAGFRTAVAMQVVGSFIASTRMHRILEARTDDDNYLAQTFRFIVARWVLVLGVVFFLAEILGGVVASVLVVLVYAGGSIWFTLFPESAHRMFFPRKDKR